jgi:hypothetical protein
LKCAKDCAVAHAFQRILRPCFEQSSCLRIAKQRGSKITTVLALGERKCVVPVNFCNYEWVTVAFEAGMGSRAMAAFERPALVSPVTRKCFCIR